MSKPNSNDTLFHLLPVVCTLLTAFVYSGATQAFTQQDAKDCLSDEPDRIIRGCTRILKEREVGSENNASAFFNRGNAYGKQGQLEKAIADYTKAIKYKSNFPETYYNRAIDYEKQGYLDKAIADYTSAIKYKPNYHEAFYNRGNVYIQKEQYDLAFIDFNKVLEFDPNNKVVQKLLKELKEKSALTH